MHRTGMNIHRTLLRWLSRWLDLCVFPASQGSSDRPSACSEMYQLYIFSLLPLPVTAAPIKGKIHWKFMRADTVCCDGSVGTAVVCYANTHQWTLYNINYVNTCVEALQNADYLRDVWRQLLRSLMWTCSWDCCATWASLWVSRPSKPHVACRFHLGRKKFAVKVDCVVIYLSHISLTPQAIRDSWIYNRRRAP